MDCITMISTFFLYLGLLGLGCIFFLKIINRTIFLFTVALKKETGRSHIFFQPVRFIHI
jgi:hypothetical protein